jgi:hypothetical protein
MIFIDWTNKSLDNRILYLRAFYASEIFVVEGLERVHTCLSNFLTKWLLAMFLAAKTFR